MISISTGLGRGDWFTAVEKQHRMSANAENDRSR